MRRLLLEPVVRGRRHLVLRYGLGDLAFSTSYWYDDVDFLAFLEARHGSEWMRRVYFHILAFEANKAAGLAPTAIDFGPYADLATDSFWDLWERLPPRVGRVALWRTIYLTIACLGRREEFDARGRTGRRGRDGGSSFLVLCGGGKDSLVTMKLLQRTGIDYHTFVYSHSTYGRGQFQHDLIDGLVAHCTTRQVHRAWVIDDALEAPIARVYPDLGIGGIVSAETSALTGWPCRSPSSTDSPRSHSGSPAALTSTTWCGTRRERRSTTCGG